MLWFESHDAFGKSYPPSVTLSFDSKKVHISFSIETLAKPGSRELRIQKKYSVSVVKFSDKKQTYF